MLSKIRGIRSLFSGPYDYKLLWCPVNEPALLATPQFFRSRQGAVPGGGRLTGARWSGGWAMRAVGQLSAGRGERERHAPLAGGTAPSVQGKSARPATRRQGRRLAAQRVGAM